MATLGCLGSGRARPSRRAGGLPTAYLGENSTRVVQCGSAGSSVSMTRMPRARGALEATRTSTRSPQPPTTGKEETTDSGLAATTSTAVEPWGPMCAPAIRTVGTVTKRYCTTPCQPPLGAWPEVSKLAVRVSGGSMRRTCRGCGGTTLRLRSNGSFHSTTNCSGKLLLQRTGYSPCHREPSLLGLNETFCRSLTPMTYTEPGVTSASRVTETESSYMPISWLAGNSAGVVSRTCTSQATSKSATLNHVSRVSLRIVIPHSSPDSPPGIGVLSEERASGPRDPLTLALRYPERRRGDCVRDGRPGLTSCVALRT